ncbi:MAG: hypothetical protein AB7K24_32645 [Gemmataceae bacterium]
MKIRMYRQGHGDCFLLAFRQENGDPFYMLIDCGKKKGSQIHCDMSAVVADIATATGNHLHLVVVTHEHEDHVSGFLSEKEYFEQMQIDRLWLAWTEDPKNLLANRLREKYKDTLLGLVAAANRLQAAHDPSDQRVRGILNDLLGFELSDEDRQLAAREPA